MLPYPPLKSLHSITSLSLAKLAEFERLPTDALKQSLVPGEKGSLKARLDGTILDGHHRVHILRQRGVAVDEFPREILQGPEEPAEDGC